MRDRNRRRAIPQRNPGQIPADSRDSTLASLLLLSHTPDGRAKRRDI